jgi:hypothetical protein
VYLPCIERDLIDSLISDLVRNIGDNFCELIGDGCCNRVRLLLNLFLACETIEFFDFLSFCPSISNRSIDFVKSQ